MTIGFAHFPVGANHVVAGAKNLFTSKLVAEIERNFFKLLGTAARFTGVIRGTVAASPFASAFGQYPPEGYCPYLTPSVLS
jgi:hypothetical protein